jgi:hypothetical protein
MSSITFIVGLPASGKSTLLDEYIREGVPVFDDFMKGSPRDFASCKHLALIRRHLQNGRKIILADIRLTDTTFRDEVLGHIGSLAKNVEWICYPNDAERCLRNSARRVTQQARDHEGEIDLIRSLSQTYTYPDGHQMRDLPPL